jgi:hypothetical protein
MVTDTCYVVVRRLKATLPIKSTRQPHRSRLACRLLALFGPDAPGRRCLLFGEEQKFAARCQSDAIDP